eukprot:3749571-Pyramimonas_sp.AAC.1
MSVRDSSTSTRPSARRNSWSLGPGAVIQGALGNRPLGMASTRSWRIAMKYTRGLFCGKHKNRELTLQTAKRNSGRWCLNHCLMLVIAATG